jgi:hypothetical protein
MGCGASAVPKVIIPDPEANKEHKVLCKKKNILSSDFECYKDFDDKQKWFWIDKKGSIFKDPTYVLENYVRVEGSKQGQALCVAKIGDANVKIYGVQSHEDSDDSDGYSDDDDDGVETNTEVTKMKWAQSIKIKFFTDRAKEHKIAEMKVKAKGKATKKVKTTTVTDEEGNESTSSSTDIKKKVKKLFYHFQYEPTVEGGAKFDVVVKGKLDGKEADLAWESPLFHASTKGFFNPKAQITVKPVSNPALGVLIGFLCAVELAPNDIAANVQVW